MYSNFNVKEFENLRDRSEKIFTSILENLKAIRTECSNMSTVVMSDDSNLGMRWQSLYDSMETPITNVEDTFVVVRALLDAYVENTIANEKAATKELEELDNDINSLATKAENLLSGLTALRGVGFGATAVAIPGFNGGEVKSAEDPIMVEKYAPPTPSLEPAMVEKYAPPTVGPNPTAVVPDYAPPTVSVVPSEAPILKYAPPSPTVVPAYAPPLPTTEPPILKYAPPSPTAVPAYAPPLPTTEPPILKYAPPYPTAVPAYAPPTPTIEPTVAPKPKVGGVPYWMG